MFRNSRTHIQSLFTSATYLTCTTSAVLNCLQTSLKKSPTLCPQTGDGNSFFRDAHCFNKAFLFIVLPSDMNLFMRL